MSEWRYSRRDAYHDLGMEHLGIPWHGESLTGPADDPAFTEACKALQEAVFLWTVSNPQPQPEHSVGEILEAVNWNLSNEDLERRGYFETAEVVRKALKWVLPLAQLAPHIHHDDRLQWPANDNAEDARRSVYLWCSEVLTTDGADVTTEGRPVARAATEAPAVESTTPPERHPTPTGTAEALRCQGEARLHADVLPRLLATIQEQAKAEETCAEWKATVDLVTSKRGKAEALEHAEVHAAAVVRLEKLRGDRLNLETKWTRSRKALSGYAVGNGFPHEPFSYRLKELMNDPTKVAKVLSAAREIEGHADAVLNRVELAADAARWAGIGASPAMAGDDHTPAKVATREDSEGGPLVDPEWRTRAWFVTRGFSPNTLENASRPSRKSKKIRSRKVDGARQYAAADVRRHYPGELTDP